MFTGRVSFNDFFFVSTLIGLMLWVTISLPLNLLTGIDWSHLSALIPLIVLLSITWHYFYLFKSDLPIASFLIQAIIGILIYAPFGFCVDATIARYGHIESQEDYIGVNFIFSTVLLTSGFLYGFINSRIQLKKSSIASKTASDWIATKIDLTNQTYLATQGFGRFAAFIASLALIGLTLIAIHFNFLMTPSAEGINHLIIRVSSMVIVLFLYSLFSVSLGEAIQIVLLQKKMGTRKFTVLDFNCRLKWRHDYVKYHLPAPIRKLNLRLFNQHITAYENYLRSCKGVQEKSGKR